MRSTQRSRAAVGLLAAALLVAATACGADSPDQTDSSDEASPPPAETTSPATTPATTDATEPAQAMQSTAVTVSAPFDGMVDEADYVPTRWLVPWDGGFLAIGVRHPPQPLPDELPPEIAELFPPEVVALFPDGLPDTQQEAIDILNDARLYSVVMDVLNEHPAAMAAVESMPTPDVELLASWSTDGDTWTPTQLSLPTGIDDVGQVAVADGRLTIATSDLPAGGDGPWTVTVSSTTDLQTWDTVSFPVVRPGRVPIDPSSYWVTAEAVAADDEHWVVRVATNNRSELWAGPWDGDPSTIEGRPSWSALIATSEGFLDLGSGVAFSPDGVTWTDAPGSANLRIQGAARLGDDVLAVTDEGTGRSSILLLDATGTTITELNTPEVETGFFVWGPISSPAMFVMPNSTDPTVTHYPWLLATADAETWILEEMSDFEPNGWRPPDITAANDTTVLVAMYGTEPDGQVWQRFTLPG